ncbi:hypothetical protein AB6C91_04270 [Vibrio cyclitrophicus]
MSRTADYTIKGFLYQFNKTLLDLTESDEGDVVTVEGIIEDVDIEKVDGSISAIQCKYHETQNSFIDSLIYKPILQMAETYSKQAGNISFILYLHCGGKSQGIETLSLDTLDNALKTNNQTLKKIVARIDPSFDKNSFISKVQLEFGPKIDDLENTVKEALHKLPLKGADIDCLVYPNAISKIAKLSSYKDIKQRKLTKADLVDFLNKINTTLLTKWTLSLKNKTQILNLARRQLATSLNIGACSRYFFFDQTELVDFEDQIVTFIYDYKNLYHSKPKHTQTPLFTINCDREKIQAIEYRLYKKGVKCNTGYVGSKFEEDHFFRPPIIKSNRTRILERDFDIRLLSFNEAGNALNNKKCDDFIFVTSTVPEHIDTLDTNVFQLGVENFNELKFVMQLRGTYE